MEVWRSSEMSVSYYEAARCHRLEGHIMSHLWKVSVCTTMLCHGLARLGGDCSVFIEPGLSVGVYTTLARNSSHIILIWNYFSVIDGVPLLAYRME
jgi:hypothetical protein